ncbi:MAG: DUF5655 domain-containing protein, partial [Micrococcaceae bacterium]|nr:DUF5655 domain-containing protein [Micrococcaceae bacterium]
EEQIDARAARLSKLAVSVWSHPRVQESALDAYRPQQNETARPQYELQDHLNLAPGRPMRPLFDALRTELLALDPNIGEEILKHYIAYKAETNVIDVVPLVGRLSLMLNMPFPELLDPKGLAADVTNLGRWGNGDVEIGLSTVEEIPYVLGLVRQSLDLQLSNAAETAS